MTKIDLENPVLADDELAEFRPARDVLPAEVMAAFKGKGGRPKAEAPKVPVSLRLDPDVVEAFKATGSGWQTRINDVLRQAMPHG